MNKIAIFVSGTGEATERIVKLFNEGNRVHTEFVVVDDSALPLLTRLEGYDVTKLHIPDEEWLEKSTEVAELLKEKGVKLLVLDNFDKVLPDEIMESTDGEMVRVTSSDLAPKQVVAALEAYLHKPAEEVKQETAREEENPTPETEWADALKIRFTPPKIPQTPPEEIPVEIIEEPQQPSPQPPRYDYNPHRHNERQHHHDDRHIPAMPSTWLIWSVLVTVFCCFIPGIVAIIFSSQVSSRYYAGDYQGARRASRNAEIWIIVSFVLGVLAATLYLPLMFIG